MTMPRREMATDRQITLLENLLSEHQLFSGEFDRLWNILEAHRIDERNPGDGTPISKKQASRIVFWLLRVVKDPEAMKRWSGPVETTQK